MLKNEFFTKMFTKHFADSFFIRVVVWLQFELECFLNISHCFVNKFSHSSIFFVMKQNRFKFSWKAEHAQNFFLHIWSTMRQDLLTKFSRTSKTNSHLRIIMYFGPSHSDLHLMFCFEPNAPYHALCPSSYGGAPHSVTFYSGHQKWTSQN